MIASLAFQWTPCRARPNKTPRSPQRLWVDPVDEQPCHHCAPAIVDEKPRGLWLNELFDRSTASDHTPPPAMQPCFQCPVLCGHRGPGRASKMCSSTARTTASFGGHLELIHPDKVVLEVPHLPEGATAEEIRRPPAHAGRLRTRGFRLAFDQQALGARLRNWLPTPPPFLDMGPSSPSWQPLVKLRHHPQQGHAGGRKVETRRNTS